MTETEQGLPNDDDDGPDGMLAYALAIRNPSRDDPNCPLPSFDARDWALAFCDKAKQKGYDIDKEWMISWFANALMRGYDEHAMRVADSAPAPAAGDDQSVEVEKLRAALIDCTAHLSAAISAYENFVGRSDRRGFRDPLFKTMFSDFQRAEDHARAALKSFAS